MTHISLCCLALLSALLYVGAAPTGMPSMAPTATPSAAPTTGTPTTATPTGVPTTGSPTTAAPTFSTATVNDIDVMADATTACDPTSSVLGVNGTITDKASGYSYGRSTVCRFNIQVPSDKSIKIWFNSFDTDMVTTTSALTFAECEHPDDESLVFEEAAGLYGATRHLGRFCGPNTPSVMIYSATSAISIAWSPADYTSSSWSLSWEAIEPPVACDGNDHPVIDDASTYCNKAWSRSPQNLTGDVCKITCNSGYVPVGGMRCLENGTLAGDVECVAGCPVYGTSDILVGYGSFTCDEQTILPGSRQESGCELSCSYGAPINDTAVCTDALTWTGILNCSTSMSRRTPSSLGNMTGLIVGIVIGSIFFCICICLMVACCAGGSVWCCCATVAVAGVAVGAVAASSGNKGTTVNNNNTHHTHNHYPAPNPGGQQQQQQQVPMGRVVGGPQQPVPMAQIAYAQPAAAAYPQPYANPVQAVPVAYATPVQQAVPMAQPVRAEGQSSACAPPAYGQAF